MTPAPVANSSSHSGLPNGPSSSTSDPQNPQLHETSEADSETEDEDLQKEISRLREKCVYRILTVTQGISLKRKNNDLISACSLSFFQTHERDSGVTESSERGNRGPVLQDGKSSPCRCRVPCCGPGRRSTSAQEPQISQQWATQSQSFRLGQVYNKTTKKTQYDFMLPKCLILTLFCCSVLTLRSESWVRVPAEAEFTLRERS